MCIQTPIYTHEYITFFFVVDLALRIHIVRDLRKVEGGLHHHNAISLAGCRGQWGCGVTGLISMTKTKKSQAATTQQQQQQQQWQQATTNKSKLCGRMPFSLVVGRVDLRTGNGEWQLRKQRKEDVEGEEGKGRGRREGGSATGNDTLTHSCLASVVVAEVAWHYVVAPRLPSLPLPFLPSPLPTLPQLLSLFHVVIIVVVGLRAVEAYSKASLKRK